MDKTSPPLPPSQSGLGSGNSSTDSESDNDHHSSEDDRSASSSGFFYKDLNYNKALFRAASQYIRPSRFFRFIVYLYGERKLLVFFWAHFVATMTIWTHFGLIKFEEQKEAVPDGAPYYWWKRLAPPLEFGSMHAILFQMALIPLTMSRFTIAALSGTFVDKFVPLNRMLRIHIHLGYVMVGIVFLATVFFFAFFGLLCANGDESFCDKFTSEIMITGYCILASLLIIGGTSFCRNYIPYEVFYVVHHLVFVMYLITIVHTFDNVQRNNGRNRSQTFKWFSASILWYICDRMAMRLNHKYRARVVYATHCLGSDGSRMILLKLRRPILFQFEPGQYAYLKHPLVETTLDKQWHPFSIASGPSSPYLEFYIEVFGPDTWTGRLWDLLKNDGDNGPLNERSIDIDIMGPYGTSLGNRENFSHGLVIGAGTGIVPILSFVNEHVKKVLSLSPSEYLKASEYNNRRQMEFELARDARKGSFVRRLLNLWSNKPDSFLARGQTKADVTRQSIRLSIARLEEPGDQKRSDFNLLKKAAQKETRSIYGNLFVSFLTVLGTLLFGLAISWNTIPIDIYDGMTTILKGLTVTFQICFAVPALFVWDGNNFFSFFDFSMCVVSVIGDYFWFQSYNKNGVLGTRDLVLFSLLTAYMVGRLWVRAVCHRSTQWLPMGMKRLEVIWVTRSASLISEILPDIESSWDSMVEKWGEDATKVCRWKIFCTDKGESAVEQLKTDMAKSSLYQHGFIHFGRPNFAELIENHTLEVIDESRTSNTLLAFSGSPKLAKTIYKYQLSSYMLAAITGHKKHTVECLSESYGGTKKPRTRTGYESLSNSEDFATNDNGSTSRPKKTRRVTYIDINQTEDGDPECSEFFCDDQSVGLETILRSASE